MTTKHKTPLSGFPHAKPRTLRDLDENIKVAQQRLEGCLGTRDHYWAQIMEKSERGMLGTMIRLRDLADEQGGFALRLQKKILEWEKERAAIEMGGMARR